MSKTAIIAHRGASKLEHQNTLAAFQKAIDLGAEIIELDVRQFKDGQLAVFHDSEIGGKNISELTSAEINFISREQNYEVPTLEQALALIGDKVKLQVEIKAFGYETQTADVCLKYLKPENFYIISFEPKILKKIKSLYPQIKIGLILGTRYGWWWQMFKFILLRNKILSEFDMLSINWKLWQAGFATFLPENYLLTVWTADEPELIRRLLSDASVKAIASNRPDLALKLRAQIYAA